MKKTCKNKLGTVEWMTRYQLECAEHPEAKFRLGLVLETVKQLIEDN